MTLALTLGLAASAGAYSWDTYNGSQYSLTDSGNDWLAAEAEAVTAGGHLVTINDQAEQNFLITTFGYSVYRWIGFTDQETEGTWKWISGEPVTYSNWGLGQPDNLDYALMPWKYTSAGNWAGVANDYGVLYGIIEKPVPLPSTLLLLASGLAGLAAWRRRRG